MWKLLSESTGKKYTPLLVDAQVFVLIVSDAQTQEVQPFLIQCDHHGMTVELPNGHIVTLDLSGGVVSVYHTENSDDTGENIRQIPINPEG